MPGYDSITYKHSLAWVLSKGEPIHTTLLGDNSVRCGIELDPIDSNERQLDKACPMTRVNFLGPDSK